MTSRPTAPCAPRMLGASASPLTAAALDVLDVLDTESALAAVVLEILSAAGRP